MTRIVPAAILSGLANPEVEPFYAVEFQFDSGTLRLWTGYGDRTIDGNVYTGSGNLMTISDIEEVQELSAKVLAVALNGIPSDIIALALTEPYQGRVCRVLFGLRDVDDFVEVFSGYMNTMSITDSGDTSDIVVSVDSKLVSLERSKIRRYTHESQQARHAGDNFFSYVTKLQDKQIQWGK
jgi:hypothetical protein